MRFLEGEFILQSSFLIQYVILTFSKVFLRVFSKVFPEVLPMLQLKVGRALFSRAEKKIATLETG
jgi:hypothetical protein